MWENYSNYSLFVLLVLPLKLYLLYCLLKEIGKGNNVKKLIITYCIIRTILLVILALICAITLITISILYNIEDSRFNDTKELLDIDYNISKYSDVETFIYRFEWLNEITLLNLAKYRDEILSNRD